ncbi:MAG TPA: mannosyltransferase family protein [Micromonosporaceae bacterium]|nr:mannosyltransferase family protein [Micromonosporaceae bacterium]
MRVDGSRPDWGREALTEDDDRAWDPDTGDDAAAGTQAPDEPRTPEEGWPAWRRALRAALPVWGLAYLGYLAVTYFAWFHPARGPALRDLLLTWRRFDATWFAEIASHGYDSPQWPGAPAFFPLYPALGAVADPVLPGDAATALQVVSVVSLLAALTVAHRLVEAELGEPAARRAVWLYMLFPSAFFLALGFNESLFVALMLASLYAMRRGRWWAAGALGGAASLTRSVGILLFLAFAYEYLRQRGFRLRQVRLDVLAGALVPAGLASYMLYLWAVLGDPFAFSTRMAAWGRSLDWPWVSFAQTAELMSGRPLVSNNVLHLVLDLAVVLGVTALLVLGLVGPWRLRRDQLLLPLFGLALVLFAVSFPPSLGRVQPLMSAPRHMLEVFPAFVVLARIRPLERPYAFVALLLQGALLAHFVRGGWLA